MTKNYLPKKRRKKSSLKRKIFGGLFFCLLAGLIYFFVWSPVLWIEQIEIKGTEKISSSEIKGIVEKNLGEKFWWVIPQKSIILAPLKKIEKEILERFPELESANVYKKEPNYLIVEVAERQKIGVWCQIEKIVSPDQSATTTDQISATSSQPLTENNQEIAEERKIGQCFYIDRQGIIFKESFLISGSLVLNIYSVKNKPAHLPDQVASSETIDFILAIKDNLPKIKTATGIFLRAVDFEIIGLEDLRVKIEPAGQIYFNPAYSAEEQLKNLVSLLDEKIKEKFNNLEYIDLRIEGRAYYK